MPVFPYNDIWPVIADDVFIAPGAVVFGSRPYSLDKGTA